MFEERLAGCKLRTEEPKKDEKITHFKFLVKRIDAVVLHMFKNCMYYLCQTMKDEVAQEPYWPMMPDEETVGNTEEDFVIPESPDTHAEISFVVVDIRDTEDDVSVVYFPEFINV